MRSRLQIAYNILDTTTDEPWVTYYNNLDKHSRHLLGDVVVFGILPSGVEDIEFEGKEICEDGLIISCGLCNHIWTLVKKPKTL